LLAAGAAPHPEPPPAAQRDGRLLVHVPIHRGARGEARDVLLPDFTPRVGAILRAPRRLSLARRHARGLRRARAAAALRGPPDPPPALPRGRGGRPRGGRGVPAPAEGRPRPLGRAAPARPARGRRVT